MTVLGLPVQPNFNNYDIRKLCTVPPLCYDFRNLGKLMLDKDVREAIGVGDRTWTDCDRTVHTYMLGDWMTDLMPQVNEAIDAGVDIFVYSGDKDFIVNWRGGEAWTNQLDW